MARVQLLSNIWVKRFVSILAMTGRLGGHCCLWRKNFTLNNRQRCTFSLGVPQNGAWSSDQWQNSMTTYTPTVNSDCSIKCLFTFGLLLTLSFLELMHHFSSFHRNLVWNSRRHWNSFCYYECICHIYNFRFYPPARLCLQIWTMCRPRGGWTKVSFHFWKHTPRSSRFPSPA